MRLALRRAPVEVLQQGGSRASMYCTTAEKSTVGLLIAVAAVTLLVLCELQSSDSVACFHHSDVLRHLLTQTTCCFSVRAGCAVQRSPK